MHYVVLIAITAVMSASYLVELGVVPVVKFLPEAFSAIVAVYVVFAGIRTRFQFVRAGYWIMFGTVTIVILCGIISNSVASGPIIAGLRYMLRPIPFFLLPAVYPFQQWQIKQQLRLLTGFALIQLPLAAYQRYAALMIGSFSGDTVYGTVMQSAALTIFLVAAICYILAMFQARRLSKVKFSLLFVLFFIPTTINETKITVFILPLSVMITILVATERGKRLRMLGLGALILIIAGVIFVPVYDYLGRQNVATDKEISSISDMFTQKDYFDKYLNQDTKVGDKKKEIGRVDAFTVPLSVIMRDPVQFAFGLGLGNASVSSLGSQFSGEYSATLGRYATAAPSAGAILLEIGALGFLCVVGLHWMILSDSFNVARSIDDPLSALAAAWPSVITLSVICMFYCSTIVFDALSYFFWYFSGLIAARRMQLALAVVSGPNRSKFVYRSMKIAVAPNEVKTNAHQLGR